MIHRQNGQTLHLLPEKALYWEEERILLAADIHLGKAAAFRRFGAAVPEGAMQEDLALLKDLSLRTGCERLIILGDLIHAGTGLTEQVVQEVENWLQKMPCPIELVPGNHDRALLKKAPWEIAIHTERLIIKPFCLMHDACDVEGLYALGGHLHPQVAMGRRKENLRLPCFWFRPGYAVMPSFGSLTGGYTIRPGKKDRVYVPVEQEVVFLE